jgi:long-chain acyl-CoA synthetase
VVCVVVPEQTVAEAWCQANKVPFNSLEEVCKNAEFKKVVFDEIIKTATEHKLSSLEKPKDIFLYHEQFSVDNDILTPTFKLKRNIALKTFQAQIDDMYSKIEALEKASARA